MAEHEPHLIAKRQDLDADGAQKRRMVSARKVGSADRAVEDHVADMGETLLPIEVDDVPGRMAGTVEDVEYMPVERDLLALIEEAVRHEIADLHRRANHLGLALNTLPARKHVPVGTDDRPWIGRAPGRER